MSGHSLGVEHAQRRDPVQVLEEMKRLAVEQLGSVPSGLYRSIEEALHQSIEGADVPAPSDGTKTALLVLRQRNAAYVMRFRQAIAQGFDDFQGLPGQTGADNKPMRLVDEQQLELHLAGQQVAEAIDKRYTRPLAMLDGRLEALAGELDQASAFNPVGANRLAAAFVSTFRDAELPGALRPLLFRHYEEALGRVLGDLYGRINTLLASAGYAVQEPARNDAPTEPAEQAAASNATAPSPAPAPGSGESLAAPADDDYGDDREPQPLGDRSGAQHQFDELREMLHAWRGATSRRNRRAATGTGSAGAGSAGKSRAGGQPTSGSSTGGQPVLRELHVAEVVSVASLLQDDPPEPYVRALSNVGRLADTIRDQLGDGARRLGLDPRKTRLGNGEEDAIDLIGLLFESLFKTHALLDRSRRLYARLVLPYLKVAMTDQELFTRRDHPARRLLDAITEACEGNDGANPQDRELLERAAGAAQRIVADFNEDLEVFDLASKELEDLLEQQRQRTRTIERRAAESVHGRERLQQARRQAAEALRQRLADTPLTDAVAGFLVEHWQHHLVQTLLREGAESERYREALALGETLVEVDREAAQANGAVVADRLISLQPSMIACLASSGLGTEAAGSWLAGLVRDLAQPDLPRSQHAPPTLKEEPIDRGELKLIGGTDQLDADPAAVERMRKLAPGDWLRLVDQQDEAASAKIAWVSPLTARFLLVNRRGIRVLVASVEQLAVLEKQGRLVVGAEQAPFDEAMREMHARLSKVS